MSLVSKRVVLLAGGGDETLVEARAWALAKNLGQRGWSVVLASSSIDPTSVAAAKVVKSVPGASWLRPFALCSTIREIQSLGRPTVIHALDESLAEAAIATAEACAAPYVLSINDFPTPESKLRLSKRHCKAVATPGRDVAGTLIHEFGLPAGLIHVVAPGIEAVDRGGSIYVHGSGNIRPVVGSAAWKRSTSGLMILLTAARILRDSSFDCEFVILGGDQSLRQCAWRLGLIDRITFVDNPDLAKPFWRASNVFCQPAQTAEFGWTVLKAQAMGVPVIATRFPGLSELVEHGSTGLLVEPHEAEAIAGAICKLMTDPETSASLARNALNAVRTQFSPEREVEQVIKLYESIANDPGPAPEPYFGKARSSLRSYSLAQQRKS